MKDHSWEGVDSKRKQCCKSCFEEGGQAYHCKKGIENIQYASGCINVAVLANRKRSVFERKTAGKLDKSMVIVISDKLLSCKSVPAFYLYLQS